MYDRVMIKKSVNITEKTKPGWSIPTKIKEDFVEFCAEKGNIAQEDSAGALFIWQYLPPQLREWARLHAKGKPDVKIEFWQNLMEFLYDAIQGKQPFLCLDKSRQHKNEKTITDCIDTIRDVGTRYKIPDKEQVLLIASLRKALGPEKGSRAADVHMDIANLPGAAEELAAKKRRNERRRRPAKPA